VSAGLVAGARNIILCSSALSGSTLAEIVICERRAGNGSPGHCAELQWLFLEQVWLEL
jgi:hypothetical protein